MASPIYDAIGIGYADTRRPDARIEAQIHAHLGAATRVVNVGAGAGSYEPMDRGVVAVEPSAEMIGQRSSPAPVVRALAGALPFADGSFDAAMALLTVHHWPDAHAGLRELRRVTTGPIVVLTFDYAVHLEQWLVVDYFPEMAQLDRDVPSPEAIASSLGGGDVHVLPVPYDCEDGFCHAWWRRPEAYLDPRVRAGISGIARQPEDVVERATRALAADLDSGAWHRRHGDLLQLDEIDAGYRLVVAR